MTRIKIAGLCLVAVLMMSAVAVESAAAAEGGPLWYVKKSGTKETLALGVEVGIESSGTPEEFHLETTVKGTESTIKCKVLDETNAALIGGNPGTDKATVEFKECSVEGIGGVVCSVESATHVAKVIGPFNVVTTLVFPKGNRKRALDRFLPASGETFVNFITSGTFCPFKGTIHVKGCVLAELWQGGAIAASGALAKENELNFPKPALTEYEIFEGGTFKEKACKLTSQFEAEAEQPAIQRGRVKLAFTTAAKAKGYEEGGWINLVS
jgi:hypothetical protein